MSIEESIKNSELLTTVFGRWPSFHDAEILQIALDRGDYRANIPPSLLAKIHVLKLVSKDDGNGNWLWSHYLVALRFSEVERVHLGGWNLQNVLQDLYLKEFSEPQSGATKFQIVFETIFGVWAEFNCCAIEVESVGPAEISKQEPLDEKTRQERMKLVEEHLRRARSSKPASQSE